MIRKKIVLLLAIVIPVSLFFNSCKKEEVPLTADGDVLIKSIQRGDSVLYGISYYVYSWEKMTKATVYREGENTKITLDSMKYRFTYLHIPDSSEFNSSKPLRAKYIFNVDFDNGEQYETSDFLDSTALSPVLIKECYFDKEDEKLIIDWEKKALANKYRVFLEDKDKVLVYESDLLYSDQTYLWITSNSYGWSPNKHPKEGEKYKVYISAYQYENKASYYILLQSISVAESGLVEWTINKNIN